MMICAFAFLTITLNANHSETVGTADNGITYELGDATKYVSSTVPKFAYLGKIDGNGNTGNRFVDAVRNFFRGSDYYLLAAGGPVPESFNYQEDLSKFD